MSARPILLALALLAPMGLALAGSSSSGFGVSPVQLDFTDPTLLRGSIVEGSLRLHNRFQQPTEVTIEPEGDLASWVSLDSGTRFTMPASSSRAILMRLSVPENVANGDHAGHLRIRATSVGEPSGSGAALHVEVLPVVRARVSGEQTLRFALEQAQVPDRAPQAPILLVADVFNSGNVRHTPTFLLEVRGHSGETLLSETLVGPMLEPGEKRRMELATSEGLAKGPYTASVRLDDAPDASTRPIGFEVRPGADAAPPAPLASGRLESLDVERAERAGDLIAITARFVNEGLVDIQAAKLTIEIHRDGRRQDIIESDALRVPAGASIDLEAFHRVAAEGRHTVRAYVTYDGIRTAIHEATFAPGAVADAVAGTDAAGSSAQDAAAAAGADASTKDAPFAGLAVVALAALAAVALRRR